MNNTSNIIKVEDIEKSKNGEIQIKFEDFIEGINSKEPIKASLTATSLGEFIEIKGNVEGDAILECDLCLKEFEYNIDFEIEELYAKNALMEEYGLETELKGGQFVTDLKGSNSIDICDLLYQSVILDFPNKKVCGINCKGSTFLSDEEFVQEKIDPRLSVFKDIKLK